MNSLLAVAAAGAVGAVAAPLGSSTAALLAGGALVVFGVVIYLRGYLVPGTPWLTETYFPDWVLRRFEHREGRPANPHVADEAGTDAPPGDASGKEANVEAVLLDAGAVTECDGLDDLCLTDTFRTAWREQIERLRSADATRADVATVLDVDPDRLSVEEYEEASLARVDGRRVGLWESRAALLADTAAADVLQRRYEAWPSVTVQSRGRILSGLRLFLERCPSCDSPVTVDQSVVESCCRSLDVLAVTCQACDARVFEIEEA